MSIRAPGAISNLHVRQTLIFCKGGSTLDGFAPEVAGPLGLALNPEGIVIHPLTGHLLVSDEYGPSLLDINRAGPVVHRYEIPANLLPRNASPGMVNCAGDTGNTAGMRTNRGFETLAISPDCRTVYAMLDEGAGDGSVNRIVAFNTPTARPLAARTGWKWKAVSQGRGISALVAIDNHEFLVLERNNRGLGVAGELSPRTKRSSASTSLAPWTCRTCTWPPCQPIRTLL